jgi:hypothetical protein
VDRSSWSRIAVTESLDSTVEQGVAPALAFFAESSGRAAYANRLN